MPLLFTFFFLFTQQLIRHEMKEKLEKKMLHTIRVPEYKVEWVKFKKEIRVDGKMFDIKFFSIDNGEYTFTGLYDKDETALNKYFEKNTDQNKTAANHILSSLFKMLQSIYANDMTEPIPTATVSISFAPLILQHTSSPFKDILTPPPQLLLTY